MVEEEPENMWHHNTYNKEEGLINKPILLDIFQIRKIYCPGGVRVAESKVIKKLPPRINKWGYMELFRPEHPRAKKGYITEHRLVMEEKLGRPLKYYKYKSIINEVIHHINMDKLDNRAENLINFTRRKHTTAHVSYHNLCKELMKRGIVVFNKKKKVYELK